MHGIIAAIADLLHRYGYGAIVVFFVLEGSGIPVPSETMLVTAAAFAAHGTLHLRYVLLAGAIGGVLGGHAGFTIGRFGGLRLVHRFGSLFRLDDARLARGHEFFVQRGARAIFLSRSIAFLRILVPMLAGVAQMSFQRFTAANATGSLVSALLYGGLGYFFGRDLPTLEHHIAVSTLVAFALAAAITALRLWRGRRASRRLRDANVPGEPTPP